MSYFTNAVFIPVDYVIFLLRLDSFRYQQTIQLEKSDWSVNT